MKNHLTKELQDRIIHRRIIKAIINIAKFIIKASIAFSLAFFIVYFGASTFVSQMDMQDCYDFQHYEEQYPNSVSQKQISKCEVLGINLK